MIVCPSIKNEGNSDDLIGCMAALAAGKWREAARPHVIVLCPITQLGQAAALRGDSGAVRFFNTLQHTEIHCNTATNYTTQDFTTGAQ